MTAARDEDLGGEFVIAVDVDDLANELHAVGRDIVQPPDEWADEGRTDLRGEERGNVRGEISLALPQSYHHAARSVLGRHEAIRRAPGQHHDGVGALELTQGTPHRLLQPRGVFEMPLDQMRDDLGVRLRGEDVSFRAQALLDGEVVLDDAVVDHHERTRAVRVRMRVLVGGAPVSRPSRVADAHAAPQRALAKNALEHLDAPGRAPHFEAGRPQHGHSGRVVAEILETLESVHDDAHRVLVAEVAHDAAHGLSAPSWRGRAERGGGRPSLPSSPAGSARRRALPGGRSWSPRCPRPRKRRPRW